MKNTWLDQVCRKIDEAERQSTLYSGQWWPWLVGAAALIILPYFGILIHLLW